MYSLTILPFLIAFPFFTNAAIYFKSCGEMNITAVEQFDLSKYMGTWYLIKRTPSILGRGICSHSEYTSTNETFFTLNRTDIIANHTRTLKVYGELQEPNTGKFLIMPSLKVKLTIPLWVIGTDYNTYSVLWSCIDLAPDLFSISYQLSWVVSRKRHLSSEAAAVVDDIVNSKLSQHVHKPVEQSPELCGTKAALV